MIRRSTTLAIPSLFVLALAACGGSTDAGNPTAHDGGLASDGATASDDAASAASDDAGATTDAPVGDATSSPDDASVAETAPPSSSIDYAAAGPHPVAKKDGTVSGNAVHCLFPSDAPPTQGFPGVAFAHGFQLHVGDYDQILTRVASFGYVVCSTDYPGSLFSIDHRDVATAISNARAAMASGAIAGVPKVDGAHVAASGHSLGGKGAIMAVLADPAFVAAVMLDPVDGNPGNPLGGTSDAAHPQLNPTQTALLKVPMGYFGATQSHCGSNPCAPTGLDAAALYGGTPTSIPKYLWTVWDFGHMQFLDDPSCGFTCSVCAAGSSPVDPRKAAVAATAIAFLDRYVRGDATAQPWLDGAKRDAYVAAKDFWDGTSALPACN